MTTTTTTASYDFLIAGGGVSGLSLAAHLARELPEASVLVVDKNPNDLDRRNLSYWSREPTLFDAVARGSWAALDVRAPGSGRNAALDQRFALDRYRYRSLRGTDFAQAARSMCAAARSVTLVEGDVLGCDDTGGGAHLTWPGGSAAGRWLFDGRLLPDDARPHPGSMLVRQHFLGWEIETPEPRFDPTAATFLDFRVSQQDAVRFFYVLPFSARHALVELVAHDAEPDEALLREHLERHFGVVELRRLATESGVSPLSDHVPPRRLGPSSLAIGVHGGQLKASTGYAFTRIQRDCRAIVDSLRRHQHPFARPRPRRLYRWLDGLLLRVMKARPDAIAPAFAAMFSKNPIERVLRFLDEDAGLLEALWVALRMPPGPFLGELWRLVRHHRPTRKGTLGGFL